MIRDHDTILTKVDLIDRNSIYEDYPTTLDLHFNDYIPSADEIESETRKLNNGRSDGPTGMISETLKFLEEEIKYLQRIKSHKEKEW